MRHAGFISDDWGFVSMARFIDSPLLFYVRDHSSAYVYRPNGMLFWWFTVAIADNNPALHYAFNAALHLLNATVLMLIAARFTSTPAAAALGLLFAVHPIGVVTTSWLSDRYDLLATLGLLWAIDRSSAAIAAPAQSRRVATMVGSVASAGAAAAIMPSHLATTRWATSTAIENRPALASIIAQIGSRELPPNCRIHLRNAGIDTDLPGFLDNAVRASLAPTHSMQSCIVTGPQASWFSLPDSDRYTDTDWAPLVPRLALGRPISARDAGGFCVLVLADPDPASIASDRLSIVVDMDHGSPSSPASRDRQGPTDVP